MSVITRGTTVGRTGFLWCAYEFVNDFVLLYALETLLFIDTGLSTGDITSLLIVWSLTAVVCEVPSGVLADVMPRKLLMAAGPVLRSVGFGLWVAFPSYTSFLIGFVLWGVCGALQSGATEALVYDNLKHAGAADRYATYAGRARACQTLAVLSSMLVAPTVFVAGGYAALGIGSVVAGLLCAGLALVMSEHRETSDGYEGLRAYGRTLREGLAEVRGSRRVLFAVVLVAVVPMLWGCLEEFGPLLWDEFGASKVAIPYLVAALTGGVTVGALLAGAANRLPWRRLGCVLGGGAVVLTVGSLTGGVWGFLLILPAFAVFHMVGVVAEARLQGVISGPARATVTSVAGLFQEGTAIVFYVFYAVAAGGFGHEGGFALGGIAYLLVAVAIVAGVSVMRRRRADGTGTVVGASM
ncbi:MAG: MFS transporter [Stackebrandtia sp.]